LADWAAGPFTAGRVAAAWVEPQNVSDRLAGVGDSFDVSIVPFPGGRDGHKSLVASSGWFISKSSQHPQQAWKLIETLTSPEAQMAAVHAGNYSVSRISLITSPEFIESIPFDPTVMSTAFAHLVPGTFFDREAEYRGEVQRLITQMLRGNSTPPQTVEAIRQLDVSILRDANLY